MANKKPLRKPKYIETPERLYQLWQEYRQWCEQNPYARNDFRGSDAREVFLYTPRPHTLAGFQAYLSERSIITDLGNYFYDTSGAYDSYVGIVKQIKAESKGHVLDGALAGVFKENLTGRYLGIPQVVEQKITHELNEAADLKKLSTGELKQLENIIDSQYNSSEDDPEDETPYIDPDL